MVLLAPLVARISSSSLRCKPIASRFCEFWITNTIKNVTIVVPVLMISCHESEKRNSGPLASQPMMITSAAMNAYDDPSSFDARCENRLNRSFTL